MKEKKLLIRGIAFIVLFGIWTFLIKTVDVNNIGVNGSLIGFSTINSWFHNLTGVNMTLYHVTDWLGLVPIAVCMGFGMVGFIQLIKRRSLFKVDYDIILLGIYYICVIVAYLVFETIPINYRPVLINGFLEASYPSSTTLLVVSVMPTLVFQIRRRVGSVLVKRIVCIFTTAFTVFMVLGRLVSGVHWVTDIIGSLLFSVGLFIIYKAVCLEVDRWSLTKSFRN